MIQGFISLDALGEFPVLVLLVVIITQFTKRILDWLLSMIFNIEKMPAEIISLLISIILMLSISYANGSFIDKRANEFFGMIFINVINAFIVSLAANKGYERLTTEETVMAKIKKKIIIIIWSYISIFCINLLVFHLIL